MEQDFNLPDFPDPFNLPDFPKSDQKTDLSNLDEQRRTRIKETANAAFSCKDDEQVIFFEPDLLSDIHLLNKESETNPILKKILSTAQKTGLGALKFAEDEEGVHLISKDKEFEDYQRKGMEFVHLFRNDQGELVTKSLKDRKIIHHELSSKEHKAILDLGTAALSNLNKQIADREKRARREQEQGVSFFQGTKASKQKAQANQQLQNIQKIWSQEKSLFTKQRIQEERAIDAKDDKESKKQNKEEFDENMKQGRKSIAEMKELKKEDSIKEDKGIPPKAPKKKS